MKLIPVVLGLMLMALTVSSPSWSHPDSDTNSTAVEDLSQPHPGAPPMLGIHWARGFDANALMRNPSAGHGRKPKPTPSPSPSHSPSPSPSGSPSPSPSPSSTPTPSVNMIYHGGKIMPSATTAAIFWGPSWANANFAADKITGMDTWYLGFDGSNYAKTSDEYTGTGGQVGPTTTHQGHAVDTSTASSGNNTSAILSEVCKIITSPDPSGNGYYAVYTDLPRGNSGYCAWHSSGSCNGTPVQFAFFWELDGDPGCDPGSTVAGESQGLAALANVSGHELSEARSDPAGGGWYDVTGQENGDKCVWTFNVPSVTFSNGSQWKIQGEWSNAAYNAGTGYPNSSGYDGCLDGH